MVLPFCNTTSRAVPPGCDLIKYIPVETVVLKYGQENMDLISNLYSIRDVVSHYLSLTFKIKQISYLMLYSLFKWISFITECPVMRAISFSLL